MSYEIENYFCRECGEEFDPNKSNAKDPLMFCCLAHETKNDVMLEAYMEKHYNKKYGV